MDTMNITVLEDGTLKIETDKVSGPNHIGAEQFLRDVAKLAGGEITRKNKRGFTHAHAHSEEFHKH